MKTHRIHRWTMILVAVYACALSAETVVLIDFGGERGNANNAAGETNVWTYAPSSTTSITLTNHLGQPVAATLTLSGFGGVGGSSWGVEALNPALGFLSNSNASHDGVFVHAGATGTVTFVGLQPDTLYRFQLFAARSNMTDRYTFFQMTGDRVAQQILHTSGPGSGYLNHWNDDDLATLSLRPDPQSNITLRITGRVSDQAASPGAFGYLNSLTLQWTEGPPNATMFILK